MRGRVLIVAGSDSGGGAGIQADIKTVTVLGGFAMTAVTALTAQNTEGVFAIHEVPPDFVAQQMRVVLGDIGADCIKIGMLHRPEIIEAVAAVLVAEAAGVPVVVDPVMVAKGGAALLAPEAMNSLKERMVPRAAVLTPNLPEAEALTGISIADRDAMLVSAEFGAPRPKGFAEDNFMCPSRLGNIEMADAHHRAFAIVAARHANHVLGLIDFRIGAFRQQYRAIGRAVAEGDE